jgi:hypothetical protein
MYEGHVFAICFIVNLEKKRLKLSLFLSFVKRYTFYNINHARLSVGLLKMKNYFRERVNLSEYE